MSKYKVTLNNGIILDNLTLNGNNYISEKEIAEDVFSNEALKRVIIFDGEASEIIEDAVLIQLKQYGTEWWFILAEKSPVEKEKEELLAEIEAQAEAIMELAELIGGAE